MAALLLLLSGGLALLIRERLGRPLTLDAPPPRVTADPPELIHPVAPSVLDLHVTYHVQTAVESLEAAVPREFGDIEQRHPIRGRPRASYGYTAQRSPFVVHVERERVEISTVIEYQGRVWYRPPMSPTLSAGCGVGDDPRPRLQATLASVPWLTPEWGLRTHTQVIDVRRFSDDARDRCRMTVLRLDVTDRVIGATQHMLERRVERFDAAVPRWPVRERFIRLWRLLQRPIRLTPDISLHIDPYAVRLGDIRSSGDTLMTDLRILARPRIVSGTFSNPIRPLPTLEFTDAPPDPSGSVVIEGTFTYPSASHLLRRALVGRALIQEGRLIELEDLAMSGIGGGKVALAVRLSGRLRGTLYFTGTPSLDSVAHQIHVPDLEYDVGTAAMLVDGLAWLRGVDLRDWLRARARLPDSSTVGRLSTLAEREINRRLARGVMLRGWLHDAQGTSVRATTQELRLRAIADAGFTLEIDRSPSVPWPVRRAAPTDVPRH